MTKRSKVKNIGKRSPGKKGTVFEVDDIFEVDDEGTLSVAAFYEPKTQAELYDLSARCVASGAELAKAMYDCEPLASEMHYIYSDVRAELQSELDEAESQKPPKTKRIAELKAVLREMPEGPEEGAERWVKGLDEETFKSKVVEKITRWLAAEPDWNMFQGFPNYHTAVGAALAYFENLDFETVSRLGVKIIEGEHPGSTYYAAELRRPIEEANDAARAAGLAISFVKASTA